MKLLFLGDFFFDYNCLPEDFRAICRFVKENDYHVILNLETSLGGQFPIKKRGPALQSNSFILKALEKLNVKAVCLANNHMMDYGTDSLQRTLQQLKKNNILYVGAGPDMASALQALEIPGTPVVLQNFAWEVEEAVAAGKNTAGVAPLDRNLILQRTRTLKQQQPDKYIVNIYHWGFEFNLLPMPLDIQFAHQSLEAGSDLIIGHHPHVIQPYEIHKDHAIFYSLGNFYFGSRRSDFKKVFKNHTPANACDFGLGVVLDTSNLKVTNLVRVVYDKAKNESIISLCKFSDVENISGVEPNTAQYYRSAKSKSANFTPILTVNPWINYIKLKGLFLTYFLAKITKPLRKLEFVKKMMK